MNSDWRLPGDKKDAQSVTRDWVPARTRLIEGVRCQEVRNVIKSNGTLTEIYRKDWQLDAFPVEQVFQVQLNPGGLSAWHAHEFTTDRLFASTGNILIVLYDARVASSTYRQVNEFRHGTARPALVTVPPGVWHGVCNIGHEPAMLINMVDRAYQYEDPDHWRVPFDSPEIPYIFADQLWRRRADALG
jgi:dTDP-4-dehydrorhamnose 3,5-epimerase